jgi:hypothetical protein
MDVKESCFRESVSANIEFLLQAYCNTQQVIQFFDTKAGAYVAVNGVLASLLVSSAVRVMIGLSQAAPGILKNVLLSLVGAVSLVFLYQLAQVFYRAFLVLYPRRGPELVEKGAATGLFWAMDVVAYLQDHSLEEYADSIGKMTEEDLIVELSYEAAKLSRITSSKLEHLEDATDHCKWAVLLWAALLLIVGVVEVILPTLQ